ncbi:hypothetical protein [Synechococcus sp. LTW-R]|uniref:hypothetical protein n=1 Tax=Synechococcus sp. LTW-R TaxID=2751170 RepID=UPI0016271860|nr:hypothetical protein [Synechococcus sp. LTW-R]QNG28629.1 hypothetical protein H0O22_07520 [Synechococcus sp. LTW-R]
MIEAAFSLINLALLTVSILLSFSGFPFGLVSFLGYLLSMTSIGVIIGVWGNPGKEHRQLLTKVFTSLVGIGLLLLGNWIIDKGGLVSITVGDAGTGDAVSLAFSNIAWITGLLAAIKGTHKGANAEEHPPGQDSPLDAKVEYLLRLKIRTSRRELIVNISSTLLALASIALPLYYAMVLGDPLKLLLLLLFPISVFSMGFAVRGGGLLVYLPTITIGVLLTIAAAPWWYFLLGISLCVVYYQTVFSIPRGKREESELFDKWNIEQAVKEKRADTQQ